MDTAGDISIELVERVELGIVGVMRLADRLVQADLRYAAYPMGNWLFAGEGFLHTGIDGGLDEAVLEKLGEWIGQRGVLVL